MVHTKRSTEVIRRLLAEGWREVDQRGSHRKFKHPRQRWHVIVQHPRRDIPVGTLRSIYEKAGWPWN